MSAADQPGPVRRPFDALAGTWKLACAVAVLVGHNLVTVTAWRPDDGFWSGVYHLVQFFSPLHFFFFSGYLAASALLDTRRPLGRMMAARGARIYVLIVAALAWGLLARMAFTRSTGVESLGTLWPLPYWDGDLDLLEALRHLNPVGFADHVSFNYAVWYLYQEFRLVLLFPLFRFVLSRPSLPARVGLVAATMVAATVVEFLTWQWFPLFRSSPSQSFGYGCVFLAGAIVWMELRPGGALSRLGRLPAAVCLLSGVAISFLESMGIRAPVDNPMVLMAPTMVGQVLVVAGLARLFGDFPVPGRLRKACDDSVGIYIVHPPIHMVAAWMAIRQESLWPIAFGIAVSLIAGHAFHAWLERPSQRLIRRWVDGAGA